MTKKYVTNPPIKVLKPLPPQKTSNKPEEQPKAKKKSKKKENGKG